MQINQVKTAPFRISQTREGQLSPDYFSSVIVIFRLRSIFIIASLFLVSVLGSQVYADQVAGNPLHPSVIQVLMKWTPLIFLGPPGQIGGFTLNILVSFLAMAMGTVSGLILGLARVSSLSPVRRISWLITQFFRNSPWLVVLFYFMLLIPFTVGIFGHVVNIPGWVKAAFAFSLPIMANISEIVRGAIVSIPRGQWEAAESLAFTRGETLRKIILPQCIRRMLPLWTNWYAILVMSTPLMSVLGVSDAMSLTQDATAMEGRSEYLIPMYLWLLSWFFLYCYPIARLTSWLEKKYA